MKFKLFLLCLVTSIVLSGCHTDNSQLYLNTSYTQTTTAYDSCIDTSTTYHELKSPVEADEIFIQGQYFAENYAKMSWQYLHGAAWFDYADTEYFDFNDKSADNYFEKDGIPFFKLLITEYTYDELIEYIKSFYTDEAFDEVADGLLKRFIEEKDNCIFVNGNEPTFLYPLRNKRAQIIGYNVNNDNTITYNCFSERFNEDSEDIYFSFTLDKGKLCIGFEDSELGLFDANVYKS